MRRAQLKDGSSRRSRRAAKSARRLLWPLLAVLLLVAVLAAWSLLRFGSLWCAFAYLSGYSIVAEEAVVSVADASSGEEIVATFRLRNLWREPVRVVGAKADCGCVAVDDLPLTVPPGKVSEMTLRIRTRNSDAPKSVKRSALLYLDVDSLPVFLTAILNVLPKEEGQTSESESGTDRRE